MAQSEADKAAAEAKKAEEADAAEAAKAQIADSKKSDDEKHEDQAEEAADVAEAALDPDDQKKIESGVATKAPVSTGAAAKPEPDSYVAFVADPRGAPVNKAVPPKMDHVETSGVTMDARKVLTKAGKPGHFDEGEVVIAEDKKEDGRTVAITSVGRKVVLGSKKGEVAERLLGPLYAWEQRAEAPAQP